MIKSIAFIRVLTWFISLFSFGVGGPYTMAECSNVFKRTSARPLHLFTFALEFVNFLFQRPLLSEYQNKNLFWEFYILQNILAENLSIVFKLAVPFALKICRNCFNLIRWNHLSFSYSCDCGCEQLYSRHFNKIHCPPPSFFGLYMVTFRTYGTTA